MGAIMRRLVSLLILVAACSPSGTPTKPVVPPSEAPPAPASPPTGVPKLREMHDLWADLIDKLEKRIDAAKADGSAPPEKREIEAARSAARKLVVAAEMAAKAEARQLLEKRHAALVAEQGELLVTITATANEAQKIEEIIREVEKGTREVPAGRTIADLKDTLADLQESVRSLEKERAAKAENLVGMESVLNGGGDAPFETDTLLTRELESARALERRAEALATR